MAGNMFCLSRQINKKRTRRRKKSRNKKSRIELFSLKLKKNTPQSEVWFLELYKKETINRNKLKHYKDLMNEPLGRFIPDIHNKGYKYVIEVDGSIHDSEVQKFRDAQKDTYYLMRGYTVIRVKAYDMESYKACIEKIKSLVYKG